MIMWLKTRICKHFVIVFKQTNHYIRKQAFSGQVWNAVIKMKMSQQQTKNNIPTKNNNNKKRAKENKNRCCCLVAFCFFVSLHVVVFVAVFFFFFFSSVIFVVMYIEVSLISRVSVKRFTEIFPDFFNQLF